MIPTLEWSEEYDLLMQEEYDYYEGYCEDKFAKDETPLTIEAWRERRKDGWWGLR